MNNKDKAKLYFNLFNKGDVEGLKSIYSQEIKLTDWNGEWNGLNQVINMNQSLFEDLDPKVSIIRIEEINNRVYCLINIDVGDENIKVMDVIDFDNEDKISKIEAFKG